MQAAVTLTNLNPAIQTATFGISHAPVAIGTPTVGAMPQQHGPGFRQPHAFVQPMPSAMSTPPKPGLLDVTFESFTAFPKAKQAKIEAFAATSAQSPSIDDGCFRQHKGQEPPAPSAMLAWYMHNVEKGMAKYCLQWHSWQVRWQQSCMCNVACIICIRFPLHRSHRIHACTCRRSKATVVPKLPFAHLVAGGAKGMP